MEPNEMKRFEFWRNVNGGLESSVDEDGHWVRYSDAMQIITALQAKIDGMIGRPTVEAFMLTPNGNGSSGLYVNGIWCGDLRNAEAYILVKRLTKALGMDDSTNTKEPQ